MTGCVKILRFSTKREAKRWMKRGNGNNGLSLRHAYWCQGCGCWHLTGRTANPDSPLSRPPQEHP